MIEHAITTSFLLELYSRIHGFATDAFKIALYTETASIGKATAVYTTTNEVSGPGYTAGGQLLVASASMLTFDSDTLIVDWNDPLWASATFTALGALIYNSSQGNRSVCVIDFVTARSASNNDFTFQLPLPTKEHAIIRGIPLR